MYETIYIHCSKDLKEHRTSFSYIAVLNTPSLLPHSKAINYDPECPLPLHHLNNSSKSLTTRNLIQKSNDAKEAADILDCCGLPLNGGLT